jgi:hypothetical protein
MYLSKNKFWYSNNCLYMLTHAVPFSVAPRKINRIGPRLNVTAQRIGRWIAENEIFAIHRYMSI